MSELARVVASDVQEGKPLKVDGGPHGICLVRLGERFFALSDRCSHAEVSLSEGEVDPDECTVECWKHGSAFSLSDGEPQSLPATRAVAVYRTTVEGEEVVISE